MAQVTWRCGRWPRAGTAQCCSAAETRPRCRSENTLGPLPAAMSGCSASTCAHPIGPISETVQVAIECADVIEIFGFDPTTASHGELLCSSMASRRLRGCVRPRVELPRRGLGDLRRCRRTSTGGRWRRRPREARGSPLLHFCPCRRSPPHIPSPSPYHEKNNSPTR